MKICKYCGARNKNSAEKCASCSSSDFFFRCENCGTEFASGYCPKCGVKGGRSARMCPSCGAESFSKCCPECGADMSTGRHHSSVTQTQTVIVKVGADEKKKGGGFGRFIFAAVMPYVAVFFAAFGKLYRTTGARIAVGVYSIIMALLFVVMTITQGANTETVGTTILMLIGAAVGVIAIIRASRDGKESRDEVNV